MKTTISYLVLVVCLLAGLSLPTQAQQVDDLQEYLDKLAASQTAKPRKSLRRSNAIEIPVGLTEVDLSKFSSYKNRTKVVEVKASVKFTNGTISASSDFSGGTSLLKISGGATVVIDATAGVDASLATSANCKEAVGIYGGSTFYQCGDITAPGGETGTAVYLDTSDDTYIYVSGKTIGSVPGAVEHADGDVVTATTVEGLPNYQCQRQDVPGGYGLGASHRIDGIGRCDYPFRGGRV